MYRRIHCSALGESEASGKKKKAPLTGDWLDQLWTIHPMERYEGVKTNEKAPGALIQKDHQHTL